jgi:hypothetical protein
MVYLLFYSLTNFIKVRRWAANSQPTFLLYHLTHYKSNVTLHTTFYIIL